MCLFALAPVDESADYAILWIHVNKSSDINLDNTDNAMHWIVTYPVDSATQPLNY